jgi:hypothetical protein
VKVEVLEGHRGSQVAADHWLFVGDRDYLLWAVLVDLDARCISLDLEMYVLHMLLVVLLLPRLLLQKLLTRKI